MIGFILIFLIPVSVIVVFAFIISFIYAFIHRVYFVDIIFFVVFTQNDKTW